MNVLTKKQQGGAGRGQGRKPLVKGEKSVLINFRATALQKVAFHKKKAQKIFRIILDGPYTIEDFQQGEKK